MRSLFLWPGCSCDFDRRALITSRLALLVLSPDALLGPGAGASLQDTFRRSHWDGFVLDAAAPRPDPKKAPLPLEAALAALAK